MLGLKTQPTDFVDPRSNHANGTSRCRFRFRDRRPEPRAHRRIHRI